VINPAAIRCTRSNICAYETLTQTPSGPRLATKARSGASCAQRSSASIMRAGYGLSTPRGRRMTHPSWRRSKSVKMDLQSKRAPRPSRSVLVSEPERTNCVLFQNEVVHFRLETGFLEFLHPTIRRDKRIVRTKEILFFNRLLAYCTSCGGKYLGNQPDKSM